MSDADDTTLLASTQEKAKKMFKDLILHRVPQKHVTTFCTITLTISVRLQ